jgi:DNA polymerase III subunit epsilon
MLSYARTAHEVVKDYVNFIVDDLIIAHNANFDVNFLYDLIESLKMNPFTNNFVDTLRLSRKIHKDLNNHKLDTLCEFYKVDRKEHRSLSDCIATYEVYKHFFNHLKETLKYLKKYTSKRKKWYKLYKIDYLNKKTHKCGLMYKWRPRRDSNPRPYA